MPGPTIEVNEGDRVRFVVENRLPELFSMHWHGLEMPDRDGRRAGDLARPDSAGRTFVYEFTLQQNGTFFYHSHMAMQEMMGMIGLFIVHPRRAHAPRVDRDFGIVLQELGDPPEQHHPEHAGHGVQLADDQRQGRAGDDADAGEAGRARAHPADQHGDGSSSRSTCTATTFYVTGTEGGRIRTTAVIPENTVLVGVAQARDIEFDADNPGDWMVHCHLPHHMMNQMVTMVGPL